MRRPFLGLSACALVIALFAAIAGALRPILLTALLGDEGWASLLFGTTAPQLLRTVPTIYAILILELVEGAALITLGIVLSRFAVAIGRAWRARLSQTILHTMASDTGEVLTRYVALTKTYIEVAEQFFRQYLVQSIAASVQLIVSLALAWAVNKTAAVLLLAEIACLLFMTMVYARIYVRLATTRLAADERLLSSTSLNPRKGLAIWFGGLGSLWFRERLKEIRALAEARLNLSVGEASYAQATTIAIGLFVVLGFVVIVNGGYGGKTDFLAFLLYSGLMMGPVIRISSFVPEYREYALAARGLNRAVEGAPKRGPELEDRPLSFAGIDFRTAGRSAIDITLEPGDRVAMIGPSGSGKTSAIEALLGAKEGILQNPAVLGRVARDVRLALPHRGVRYLTEAPAFETGTVLFNCQAKLSTCREIIARFELFREMDHAALNWFMQRSISQSGEPLSLGERQRVQFIRTMAAKPSVLFLDEALSGIEEDREREIIGTLIEERSISILVYIGHRRSIQKLFDKQIRLRPWIE
jgi:ABC-type bacteriocin/lantibiotic exporter with double-glycine peptidase domain